MNAAEVDGSVPKVVLSAPVGVDTQVRGVRVYEQLTRLGEQRRYSPFESSWVAVYRGVDDGKNVLVLTGRDPEVDAFTLMNDVKDWEARGLVEVVNRKNGVATINGFGGVRLRAMVEATVQHAALFPVEAVLAIGVLTARKAKEIRAAGAAASDTFIGFDGAITILPRLVHAVAGVNEMQLPLAGDEIFDHLVVNNVGSLREVLTCEEPPPVYGMRPEGDALLAAHLPPGLPQSLVSWLTAPPQISATNPTLKMFEQTCLRILDELGGMPPPSLLGSIARTLFPESYERQRAVDEELALR